MTALSIIFTKVLTALSIACNNIVTVAWVPDGSAQRTEESGIGSQMRKKRSRTV
jgi:hypothetical protein